MSLHVLITDDEALARSRLRSLLAQCASSGAVTCAQAANAVEAMTAMQHEQFDAVLLDINMPGTDGLALVQAMRQLARPPAVVFVTAHAQHALTAFELEALDYLTKPVRLERLQAALDKVARWRERTGQAHHTMREPEALVVHDRGRTERVPLAEVIFFKAELKYVTLRTAAHVYILDQSLNELEERFGLRFLRVHRNALVARWAIRALEKHHDPEEGDGWALRLEGVGDLLAVSRRQMTAVREAMGGY